MHVLVLRSVGKEQRGIPEPRGSPIDTHDTHRVTAESRCAIATCFTFRSIHQPPTMVCHADSADRHKTDLHGRGPRRASHSMRRSSAVAPPEPNQAGTRVVECPLLGPRTRIMVSTCGQEFSKMTTRGSFRIGDSA